MSEDIKGESSIYSKNGLKGVNLSSGAFVGYRTGIRKKTSEVSDTGDETARLAARFPAAVTDTGDEADRLAKRFPGAEPEIEMPAEVENFEVDFANNQLPSEDTNDLRAILKVPTEYLSGNFGDVFASYHGILFPYTPNIQIEHKAEYSPVTPLHSNYPINFYKYSSITDIGMTANFTVQGPQDALYYLAARNILAALTKMRFGVDPLAGSPPPICRLWAYGEYMLKNVPVVLTSFRNDLPDDVDYYRAFVNDENVMVPTKSTFTMNFKPTYSRKEMMDVNVPGYLQSAFKRRGYL